LIVPAVQVRRWLMVRPPAPSRVALEKVRDWIVAGCEMVIVTDVFISTSSLGPGTDPVLQLLPVSQGPSAAIQETVVGKSRSSKASNLGRNVMRHCL
jgi:hypothetical protein